MTENEISYKVIGAAIEIFALIHFAHFAWYNFLQRLNLDNGAKNSILINLF